jgi:glycosyltransferase involved in cell wall biosynthesis
MASTTRISPERSSDTRVAPEIAVLPTPVLGVIGLIDQRIDIDLLCLLAARHPEWTIAVVGPTIVDTAPLAAHANIRLLGRQPYARVPELCKGLAAGLVPFVLDEHTRDINPIKLREYLSAGLPVIATALPKVTAYRPLCAVAESHDDFERLVLAALKNDSPARRAERSAMMRGEGWNAKVAALIVRWGGCREREARYDARRRRASPHPGRVSPADRVRENTGQWRARRTEDRPQLPAGDSVEQQTSCFGRYVD